MKVERYYSSAVTAIIGGKKEMFLWKEMPLVEFEESARMSLCSPTTLTFRGGGARSDNLL